MAIDTTYGGGNTSTVTQSPALDIGGGDMEFWREMARRSMAKQQQQPAQQPMMGRPMRRSGGSGTGPVTRERVRSSGPMGGQNPDEHSWVTNIKGGPQVMGGMVSSGFGASPGNTFYGGWRPGGAAAGSGAVNFANAPDNSMTPALSPMMDPAARARMVNSGLPSAGFDPMMLRR